MPWWILRCRGSYLAPHSVTSEFTLWRYVLNLEGRYERTLLGGEIGQISQAGMCQEVDDSIDIV
jgi:hypothetical protein